MKDQYVGDINDFVKYSVLRTLQGGDRGADLLVAWMLTSADDSSDGMRTSYLSRPNEYRAIDPALFDGLHSLVESGERSTKAVETAELLPRAFFARDYITDSVIERDQYFADLHGRASDHGVVFLDPDNGLDVRSVPRGKRGSRRYVYCSEVEPFVGTNTTLVVYQHFPRVARQPFVRRQLERLQQALPGYRGCAVYSPSVAFLAVCPERDHDRVSQALTEYSTRWGGRVAYQAG